MPPQLGPQQQDRGVKRKKPPTFQHLPADRAKKLKRSWVEVQKIKSKWKAQKRKEGLIAPRSQLEQIGGAAEGEREQSDNEENEEVMPASRAKSTTGGNSKEDRGDEKSEDESADEAPSTSKPSPGHHGRFHLQRQRTSAQEKKEEQPSWRELQRMAYSKSSLHNHKSRPLNNRHKGPASAGGLNDGRGSSSHRGALRGRGRGQPDMGLRMKAMLEKIKQDLS
ncbi:hypothetical protein C8Q79DRAFT_925732 [Trametes meyenii]|nr:hypothetical protein C8Q79DRAFT_925732 [Trametes meyenii]